MSAPILIVGAGKMGTALIRGWVKAGLGPITAVEPNPSPALRELGPTVVPDLASVPSQNWRACIVALKPHIVRAEAAKLSAIAASGALMISIAAGTDIALLQNRWGAGAHVVRVMPNTPGSIGRGISGLYAAPNVTPDERAFAEQLLSSIGLTVWLEREDLIDAVTAVSGSGPAYIFALVDAMAQAGVAAGLPLETAMLLARTTITGAGALLDADPRPATDLARDVTTPGGTTAAALAVLQASDGLTPLMTRAVAAAKARAEELARG